MKATLELPDELMREVKVLAVMRDTTIKALMTEIVQFGIGVIRSQKKKAKTRYLSPNVILDSDGFPLAKSKKVKVKLTLKEALQLEQDSLYAEDMQRVGLAR